MALFLSQLLLNFAYAKLGQPVFYIVQENDTLSQILKALNLQPIYGPNGSLSKIQGCHKFKKNGNLIKPGDIIRLSYALDPQVINQVQLKENSQLVILGHDLKSQISELNQNRQTSLKQNENLCLNSEFQTAFKAKSLKKYLASRYPQTAHLILESESKEKQDSENTKDSTKLESRSFFLAEATSALSRQDLRTQAGGYSEILSKFSPGFRFQWREEVSESWDLDLSYSQYSLSQMAPEGLSLSGNSSFTDLGIAGLWNFKEAKASKKDHWRVGSFLKYRSEPISAKFGGNSVRLESPHLFLLGGILESESSMGPQNKNLSLKTNISIWYAPKASQSDFFISNGYGLSTDVRLIRRLYGQFNLSGGISYEFSQFKSSLGEHANQRFIFGLGLVYRFGEFQEFKNISKTTVSKNEIGNLE